jgi:hypothetical protein
MDLYILIVTHAREALLGRTLSCLGRCTIPAALRRTLVIENGARARAEVVVRSAPAALNAEYVFEPSQSKCRSLNAGIRDIGDGLVLFLDDDVTVVGDLLDRYVETAERFGPGHFFGGPIAPEYEETPPAWLHPFLPNSARGWQLEDPAELISRPRFLGFNWAAFAQDLRAVGGFDENLGPGSWTASVGDESDMQRRLMAAGGIAAYVPGALVYHWVPKTHCSPAFALQRAYRDGIRVGFLNQEKWNTSVFGYPVGLLKRIIASWVVAKSSRVTADQRSSFENEFVYRHRLGVLKGMRLRRHNGFAGGD